MNDTEVGAAEIDKLMNDDSLMRSENLFKALFFVSVISFVLLVFRLLYQIYKKMTTGEGSILTDSKPFKMMISSTFQSMDRTGNGEVTKDELYAGLLLIHLKLSKFVGAPACYPPVKDTCDSMFEAADHDHSGGIDEGEFASIMKVCCGQMMSRMMMYYLFVMLGVPFLSEKIVDLLPIENGSYWEMVTENIVGFLIFSFAIPLVWNWIDESSTKKLVKKDGKPAPSKAKETSKKTN